MVLADRNGLPVAAHVESATPHEVKLVEATLAARHVPNLPDCIVGDRAYDSDKLDAALAAKGLAMIAPNIAVPAGLTASPRTRGASAGTSVAGRSSACSPGSSVTAVSSSGTSITRRTTSAFSSLPARSSS